MIQRWRGTLKGFKDIFRYDNWIQLLISRFFFRTRGFNIYYYKKLRIMVNNKAGDLAGLNECLLSSMYAQWISQMNLPTHPVVLDIGAHIGGFALLLKSCGFHPSKIVLVEMNPNTFKRLWFNMNENFGSVAFCVQAALSNMESQKKIYLGQGSTSDHVFQTQPSMGKVQYSIPLKTFDRIFNDYFGVACKKIDVCKMDIEGSEYDVFLKSTQVKQFQKCSHLIMEIHGTDMQLKKKLVEKLKKIGFSTIQPLTDHNEVFWFTRTLRYKKQSHNL